MKGAAVLNTTQLECFLAVANFLNFSRAAEQLRITQPAVSHQINTLEDELGVKLFFRTSKNVRLSQAGLMYVRYAQEFMKLEAISKVKVKEIETSLFAQLGIGCRNFLELRLLSSVLEKLRDKMPDLVPVVRLSSSGSLDNMLTEDEVQIIFTFKDAVPLKSVYKELLRCPAVCVCARNNPLADNDILTVGQLKNTGKIAVCPPTMYPRYLSDVQGSLIAARETKDVFFCDNLEVVYALVESGYAFTIIPDMGPARFSGLCYIPLEGTETMSFGTAYLKSSVNPVIQLFLDVLKECVNTQL